jgi:6-phosphogluconate dehydrogenase
MLDIIVDSAGQKGTGRWTAIEAQHLSAPVPVIEAAVMARNVSALRDQRALGQARFGAATQSVKGALAIADLESALMAGKILCYAQGFAMMTAAGRDFGWPLPMAEIARVWRAGCIIRSSMLNDMAEALPALSAGLAWFDLMRTARGTANMIQAQRDFFGAHGFARLDGGAGTHGPWGQSA